MEKDLKLNLRSALKCYEQAGDNYRARQCCLFLNAMAKIEERQRIFARRAWNFLKQNGRLV